MPCCLLALTVLAQKTKPAKPYELSKGFFVTLPAAPVPKSKAGEPQKYWLVKTKDGVFVISSFPLDPKDPTPPDEVLANMVSGSASGGHGKLLEQRDLILQGWPGVESKIVSDDGLVSWQRNYVTNDQVYQVGAMWFSSDGNMNGSRAVLESVRLPGQGPLRAAGPQFAPYSFPNQRVSVLLPGTPTVEDLPVKNNPYGLVMHRASSSYGSRTYASVYAEIPSEAKKELTPERIPALLEKLNLDVVNAFPGKNAKSHTYKRGSETLMSTEFGLGSNIGYGRVDSMFVQGRIHTFIAVVPSALRASAEVARFFGSIKVASQ